MYGIVIDDNVRDYSGLIVSGKKDIETRNSNCFGKSIGSNIALISKKGDIRQIVGYAYVEDIKTYDSVDAFDSDVTRHLIGNDDDYHFSKCKNKATDKKYGLILNRVMPLSKPLAIDKKCLNSACGLKRINKSSLCC